MCVNAHPYGAVPATRTLTTDYGTCHVCDDCAETLVLSGYVTSNSPLKSEHQRQQCQCEHECHLETEISVGNGGVPKRFMSDDAHRDDPF